MSLFAAHAQHAKFDYYRTSIRLKSNEWDQGLAPAISDVWPSTIIKDCTPARPFERGTELLNPETRDRLLLISRGGDHVKDVTSLQSTGKNAPALAQALSAWGGAHLPSRVDSAIDWDEEGLFDSLANCAIQFAKERGIYISTPGNWPQGKERTLYIGSRNSPLMIRLYEKGYEQQKRGDENASLNWVRFEVEVKYPKAKQRTELSKLTPSQCFQLGWVSDLCKRFMFDVEQIPMPSSYKTPEFDRTLRHVQKQYKALFERLDTQCESAEQFKAILLGHVA